MMTSPSSAATIYDARSNSSNALRHQQQQQQQPQPQHEQLHQVIIDLSQDDDSDMEVEVQVEIIDLSESPIVPRDAVRDIFHNNNTRNDNNNNSSNNNIGNALEDGEVDENNDDNEDVGTFLPTSEPFSTHRQVHRHHHQRRNRANLSPSSVDAVAPPARHRGNNSSRNHHHNLNNSSDSRAFRRSASGLRAPRMQHSTNIDNRNALLLTTANSNSDSRTIRMSASGHRAPRMQHSTNINHRNTLLVATATRRNNRIRDAPIENIQHRREALTNARLALYQNYYEQILATLQQHSAPDANRGASVETISQLPVVTVTEDFTKDEPTCCICFEAYVVSNDQRKVLPCFHSFHDHCIDQWLPRDASCPMCKHRIT